MDIGQRTLSQQSAGLMPPGKKAYCAKPTTNEGDCEINPPTTEEDELELPSILTQSPEPIPRLSTSPYLNLSLPHKAKTRYRWLNQSVREQSSRCTSQTLEIPRKMTINLVDEVKRTRQKAPRRPPVFRLSPDPSDFTQYSKVCFSPSCSSRSH